MPNEVLATIIKKGQDLIEKSCGIERDYVDNVYAEIDSKPIKIITGFRRAGKSTIVKHLALRSVIKKKYKLKNILYLNFEDIELAAYNKAIKVKEIYDYFLTMKDSDRVLLIFDEIQLVEDWSKLIRSIYEFTDQAQIIITGSNSELLSSELGSNLAGRFIEFPVQSFSFKEFLLFRKLLPSNKKALEKDQKKYLNLLKEYSCLGGLPEIFAISTVSAQKSYLEGIISKVILDDIIERFKVRNHSLVEKILIYLLINIGNPISFTRIEAHCKNLGFEVKVDTIIKYVSYLEKAFAIKELSKMDWKSRKVFSTDKKYYASDLGLAYLYLDLDNNFSKRLENIVYLKLIRDNPISKITYGFNEQEIDFLELDKANSFLNKYQVTLELNPGNDEREKSSLINSAYYTGDSENYLLSLADPNRDININQPGKEMIIKQRNLLAWLLDF